MSSITWLHFSDLHLRIKDDYNSSIVREAFLQDLQNFCLDNGLQLDLIFMTGDIAFSGQPEEYGLASLFFNQLLAMTQTPKDCLFLIPGNHDVSRPDITYLAANISSLLNNRDEVNHLLYSRDSSSVSQRLKNYVQFLRDYFGDSVISTAIKEEPHYFTRILKRPGKTIAVLGLNSAWLSTSDNDRYNLLIGERQVRDALRKSKEGNADYTIALIHHPFDWLKDFDADDTQALLMTKCQFMLRGHLHQTNIELISSPDGRAMRIAAGALYETREYPNAYNIVYFDLEKGEGTIYFRRYSDRSGGFFAKDTLTYRNIPDGQYNFSLRASTNIPRAQTTAKQKPTLVDNLQNSQLQTHENVKSDLTSIPPKMPEEKGEDKQTFPSSIGQSQQDEKATRLQKLTGKDREEITKAFLDAYPNQEKIEMMLAIELDKNLNALVIGDNLEIIVFRLVSKAQAEGWLIDLIIAAHTQNPGNVMLQKCYQKYILEQIAPIQITQIPTHDLSSGSKPQAPQQQSPSSTPSLQQSEAPVIDRKHLRNLLSACLPALFENIIFSLNPPSGVMSPSNTPQSQRVIELIQWVESTGPGLAKLYDTYLEETGKKKI